MRRHSRAIWENAASFTRPSCAQVQSGVHGIDGEVELLKRAEASYQEYLTLTRNRFMRRIASDLDVAQARSRLYGVQSVDRPRCSAHRV